MRKLCLTTILLVLLFSVSSFAVDAVGSMFGTLTTAQALGQGRGDLGGGVGIADATSFFGTFTYGLSEYLDGRVQAGMYDMGDGADAEFAFNADLKYQLWSMKETAAKHPFDMALGGFFQYLSGSGSSVVEVAGYVLGSYPFTLKNGSVVSPYGRLNIRLESISFDSPYIDSESNLEFGFNAGVAWRISPATKIYGEFQIDGNDGIFLGIDFNVL